MDRAAWSRRHSNISSKRVREDHPPSVAAFALRKRERRDPDTAAESEEVLELGEAAAQAAIAEKDPSKSKEKTRDAKRRRVDEPRDEAMGAEAAAGVKHIGRVEDRTSDQLERLRNHSSSTGNDLHDQRRPRVNEGILARGGNKNSVKYAHGPESSDSIGFTKERWRFKRRQQG